MTFNIFTRKIVSIPGRNVSPEVVLHRTLEKLDRIKSVAVVIEWDDESYACDWSATTLSALRMAAHALDGDVFNEMQKRRETRP